MIQKRSFKKSIHYHAGLDIDIAISNRLHYFMPSVEPQSDDTILLRFKFASIEKLLLKPWSICLINPNTCLV